MLRKVLVAAPLALVVAAGCASGPAPVYESPPALPGGAVIMQVAALAENVDPFAVGKAAAEGLLARMGDSDVHAVLIAECFEEEEFKRRVLDGVASVFPREVIFGGATYGSFGQAGCLDRDAVCLLGIGGPGIRVTAAVEEGLGVADLTMESDSAAIEKRLRAAGKRLAGKLRRTDEDRLLVVIADAHSPKNQFLVEGAQQVMGPRFPITGGSANKNAGQTFVYCGGRLLEDSAVALLLSGNFTASLAGRKAKENDKVIASAREASRLALDNAAGTPFAVMAFNCAGRKGRLENIEDELAAIRQAIGTELPLFGCYCAGEIGPADLEEKKEGVLSSGVGWHVMVTVLSR